MRQKKDALRNVSPEGVGYSMINLIKNTSKMQFSIPSASTYVKQVVNAVLTFAFGYQFASGLIPDLPPEIAAFVTGMLYLAVFDGGATGWNSKAELPDLSETQYRISDAMATLCTIASTVISAAHIMLSLRLFQSESIVEVASVLATIVTVGVVGLHFIALRYFRLHDPERAEQQLRSIVTAKVKAAKLKHFKTVQIAAVSRVQELAGEHTDELAELFARNLVLDFKASARRKTERKTTTKKKKPGNGRRSRTKRKAKKEVDHSTMEEAYIEYEEVVDEAKNAQATNLNMAGA